MEQFTSQVSQFFFRPTFPHSDEHPTFSDAECLRQRSSHFQGARQYLLPSGIRNSSAEYDSRLRLTVLCRTQAAFENRQMNEVQLIYETDNMLDRRYNAPRATVLALIYVSPEGEVPIPRTFTIFCRSDAGLRRIPLIHKMLDSCPYPLFFIPGDFGYHYDPSRMPMVKLCRRSYLSRTTTITICLSVEPSILHILVSDCSSSLWWDLDTTLSRIVSTLSKHQVCIYFFSNSPNFKPICV